MIQGPYLPSVDEIFVKRIKAHILTEKKAIHVRALRGFTDASGARRRAGEEWLVTSEGRLQSRAPCAQVAEGCLCFSDTDMYIPGVYENVEGEVSITKLTNRQFCVVLDPVDGNGRQCFGKRELRVGERAFFLLPGERLESGIQSVFVLGEEEALVLRAKESYTDNSQGEAVARQPGDLWMIFGPCEYFPPVQVSSSLCLASFVAMGRLIALFLSRWRL